MTWWALSGRGYHGGYCAAREAAQPLAPGPCASCVNMVPGTRHRKPEHSRNEGSVHVTTTRGVGILGSACLVMHDVFEGGDGPFVLAVLHAALDEVGRRHHRAQQQPRHAARHRHVTEPRRRAPRRHRRRRGMLSPTVTSPASAPTILAGAGAPAAAPTTAPCTQAVNDIPDGSPLVSLLQKMPHLSKRRVINGAFRRVAHQRRAQPPEQTRRAPRAGQGAESLTTRTRTEIGRARTTFTFRLSAQRYRRCADSVRLDTQGGSSACYPLS